MTHNDMTKIPFKEWFDSLDGIVEGTMKIDSVLEKLAIEDQDNDKYVGFIAGRM